MRRLLWIIAIVGVCWGEDSIAITEAPPPMPSESWISLDKSHKYFGLATIATAGATALLRPQYEGDTVSGYTLHRNLAYTTAGLSVATVLSGFLFHDDDWGGEFATTDYDNLHVLLATVGSIFMVSAAVLGNESDLHSKFGIAGTACMASAVVLAW